MANPLDPAKAVFYQALELDDPAARAALVAAACAGNAELRQRVEALLRAHADAGSFLEHPPAGDSRTATHHPAGSPGARTVDYVSADAPDQLLGGRYKLVERIGEGGMGTVWRARQTEPVKRHVALKLIKAGMDSKAVLARFEAERQALAMMDHPNIARALDAGAAPDGRPYFVMELVKGEPITAYCDARKLTPRERLELFVPVCLAIQHAHQKGVIHRDIKPSNVLVALYDDAAVPKVIDFGVAKATGGALTEQTLETAHGAVVGTPQYMSPEQATFNNLDVDTRSDVYSLGVLLYELLTGAPPFTKAELEKKGLLEILRIVREEEPPRPSTKLSTADALPTLSANRRTDPKKLTGMLRNELDWIVMKSLEKDRTRRYETANGFAADVLRYLAGEPVQAVPPSAGYRLRKFVRRNRGPVVAGGLVFAALVLGVVGTAFGLWRADRAARQEATRSAQLERSNEVLKSVLRTLDPHDEDQVVGPLRVQLGHRLRKEAAALDGEALGDPLAVARLQYTLGVSLLGLGYAEDALGLLTKARETFDRDLGPDHAEAMRAVVYLGDANAELNNSDEEARLHKDVFDRRTRVLGPDHPDTQVSASDYAVSLMSAHRPREAVAILEAALAKHTAARGPNDRFSILLSSNLAQAWEAAGRAGEGLKLAEATLARSRAALGPSHPRTIWAAGAVGVLLGRAGQPDRAIPLMDDYLARARAEHGADHPVAIHAAGVLVELLILRGDDRAGPLAAEVVALLTARHGPDHPKALAAAGVLARADRTARRVEKAAPAAEGALAAAERRLGPDHDTTLELVNELALDLVALKRFDRAVPLAERYLAGVRKRRPEPDDFGVLTALNNLGETYRAAGQPDRGRPPVEEAIAGAGRYWGPNHPTTLNYTSNLAFILLDLHKPAEAAALLERATDGLTAALGGRHRLSYDNRRELGRVYAELGQYQKAVAAYERALADVTAALGADNLRTLATVTAFANVHAQFDQNAAAVALLEQSVPRWEKAAGPTHGGALAAQEALAVAYAGTPDRDKSLAAAAKLFDRRTTAHGPDAKQTLFAEGLLGSAYQRAGKSDEAVTLYRGLVAKRERVNGPDDPETLTATFNLGLALVTQKKTDEGLATMERAVAAIGKRHGADSPEARQTTTELAATYSGLGRFERAIPLFEKLLERQRKDPGPGHADTRRTVALLADAYVRGGRPADALPHAEFMLRWTEERHGPRHLATLNALNVLAVVYRAALRPADAIAARERIRAAFEKDAGPTAPNTLAATERLGEECLEAGRTAAAVSAFETALAGWTATRGADAPEALECLVHLGVAYWQNREYAAAIPLYERLVATFGKAHGATHPETLLARTNLAMNCSEAGRVAEAIPLLESVLREAKEDDLVTFARQGLADAYEMTGRPAESLTVVREQVAALRRAAAPDRGTDLLRAGRTLLRLKAWAEAEAVLREGIDLFDKASPQVWRAYSAESMLGQALFGQKKLADAEKRLVAGYEGMKKAAETLPPAARIRLIEAADRLVEFYAATGRPAELKRWQGERATYAELAPMPRVKR